MPLKQCVSATSFSPVFILWLSSFDVFIRNGNLPLGHIYNSGKSQQEVQGPLKWQRQWQNLKKKKKVAKAMTGWVGEEQHDRRGLQAQLPVGTSTEATHYPFFSQSSSMYSDSCCMCSKKWRHLTHIRHEVPLLSAHRQIPGPRGQGPVNL